MSLFLKFFVLTLSIGLYNGLFLKMEGNSPYCFYQDITKE